jgi:hypothetical protein
MKEKALQEFHLYERCIQRIKQNREAQKEQNENQ